MKKLIPTVRCMLFLLVAVAPALAQSPDSLPTGPLPDSLPDLAAASPAELQALAVNLSGHALALKADLTAHLAQSIELRRQAEEDLKAAQLDTTLSKSQLKMHEDNLKIRRTVERDAGKYRKRALKAVDLMARVQAMDSVSQRRNLPKLHAELLDLRKVLPDRLETPAPEPAEPPVSAGADTAAAAVPDTGATPAVDLTPAPSMNRPARKFKSYDPGDDVMVNPPQPPCVLAVSVRDEFSGETRRELQRAEFFRHTKPGARTTGGQPHVICEAALGSSGPTLSLNLVITILDPGMRRTFGGLARNGIAILKFLDGSTFTLYNLRADDGAANPGGPGAIFRGQYPLDKAVQKKIRAAGLDKIRLAWNAGYEDYEIHHVDLLKHQIKCLLD
jgi:hypothetical protein